MSHFDTRLKPLGIADMDADHLQLVVIANRIDEIANRPRPDQLDLAELIAQLKSKTQEHFEREEHFMASIGFPELEAHAGEHATLLASLDKLVVPASSGQYVAQNLRQYMAIWLFEHIDTFDARYAAFVPAAGAGSPDR